MTFNIHNGRYDRDTLVETAALIRDMGLMKPVSTYAEKVLGRKRKLTFLNDKHHQWYDKDASNRYTASINNRIIKTQ